MYAWNGSDKWFLKETRAVPLFFELQRYYILGLYIRCIDRRNLTKNFEKVRKNVWFPQDSRWSAPVGNHNLNLLCFMICISTMPSDAR